MVWWEGEEGRERHICVHVCLCIVYEREHVCAYMIVFGI